MSRHAIAFLILLLLASATEAVPPTITSLTPRGVERGKAVEITVVGTNLTPQTRLLLPFQADIEPLPDPKPNPALARFRLTVNAATPTGIYLVRALTEDGISSGVLFCVDALPNVVELEDNNTPEKAQKLTLPVIVTGQCAGGDVDYYRCALQKGQRLVVESEAARLGSGVMPQLRVTDSRQRFVAADDSQSVQGDSRVVIIAPADDEYLIEFSDSRYRGANPPHYRLRLGDFDVVGEVFPLGGRRGDTVEFTLRGGSLTEELRIRKPLDDGLERGKAALALDGLVRPGSVGVRVAVGDYPERLWIKSDGKEPRALDLLPPITINSRLERPAALDRFQMAVTPGQRYRFEVQAESLGSSLDPVLTLRDPAGRQLALADDATLPPAAPGLQPTRSADPSLDFTVPNDVSLLLVEVRDQRQRGGLGYGYRMTVTPAQSDFVLEANTADLNLPRGGSASVPFSVVRRGFTGPLRVNVHGVPAGISVQGGSVPASATAGVLTLTASPDAALEGLTSLTLEGVGKEESGGELRRKADCFALLSRDAGAALQALRLPTLAMALTPAEPFTVQGPPSVEVVRGYPATLPITLTRAAGQMVPAIQVTATVPVGVGQQPPLTFQPTTAAADATTATLMLTVAATAPMEQAFDIVPEGRARVGNVDRVVTGPTVSVTVLPPFTVKLPEALDLEAGKTTLLKGQLVRHSLFKESVRLQFTGLPAGVTLAQPLPPIAADRDEFQMELKADANAAGRMANAQLTCSATVGGMNYAHPAVAVVVRVTPAR